MIQPLRKLGEGYEVWWMALTGSQWVLKAEKSFMGGGGGIFWKWQ